MATTLKAVGRGWEHDRGRAATPVPDPGQTWREMDLLRGGRGAWAFQPRGDLAFRFALTGHRRPRRIRNRSGGRPDERCYATPRLARARFRGDVGGPRPWSSRSPTTAKNGGGHRRGRRATGLGGGVGCRSGAAALSAAKPARPGDGFNGAAGGQARIPGQQQGDHDWDTSRRAGGRRPIPGPAGVSAPSWATR